MLSLEEILENNSVAIEVYNALVEQCPEIDAQTFFNTVIDGYNYFLSNYNNYLKIKKYFDSITYVGPSRRMFFICLNDAVSQSFSTDELEKGTLFMSYQLIEQPALDALFRPGENILTIKDGFFFDFPRTKAYLEAHPNVYDSFSVINELKEMCYKNLLLPPPKLLAKQLNDFIKEADAYLNLQSKSKTVQAQDPIVQRSDLQAEPLIISPSKLKGDLSKYEIFELEKLRGIDQDAFIELLIDNFLPYQIAMLDHIGFTKHLKKYFTSDQAIHCQLAKILNSKDRTVKGNMLVLNEFSKENKKRYTAHAHKLIVAKDLRELS